MRINHFVMLCEEEIDMMIYVIEKYFNDNGSDGLDNSELAWIQNVYGYLQDCKVGWSPYEQQG